MNRNRVHFMLSSDEADLIDACARGFGSRDTHLRPMGRYGHSGSSLFVARFDKQGAGADYVIKITPPDRLERELRGLRYALQYFPDAVLREFPPQAASGPGATLSRLFTHASDSIVELEEQVVDDKYSGSNIVDILNRVYAELEIPHASGGAKRESYGTDLYGAYLRHRRLDRVLDRFGDTGPIEIFGATYPNPVIVLRGILDREERVPWGFIHGDLHPKNVVLGKAGVPTLIDFAWATEGDVTLDFVLMECSIRFLLFPQNLDWGLHRRVNESLLEPTGAETIEQVLDADAPHASRYRKMAEAVTAIRRHARTQSGSAFNWEHYLRCQFIVLYGLAKVPNYPFLYVADALGLLARRLNVDAGLDSDLAPVGE